MATSGSKFPPAPHRAGGFAYGALVADDMVIRHEMVHDELFSLTPDGHLLFILKGILAESEKQNHSIKDAAALVAAELDLPKREVYARALTLAKKDA